MTTPEQDVAAAVASIAKAMDDAGLAPNKSGNVSCRDSDGFQASSGDRRFDHVCPLCVDRTRAELR